LLGALFAGGLVALSWMRSTNAQENAARATAGAEQVIITSTRPATSDKEMTKLVEAALDANRYLDASRVTVTTENGVVKLDGIVGDVSDLIAAIRISSRVASANGAKRVEESLDMPDFDCGP